MCKPLGRVLFYLRSFCLRKSARNPETAFVLATHTCVKNVGVNRMYIVAGFRMLFNCGIDISIGSGLVFGPPRFPISSAFPDIHERTCPTGHLYM